MYTIAKALEKLATAVGVEIRTNSSVARIDLDPGSRGARPARPRATGVTLATGDSLRADAVLCNADVVWAYQNLIASEHRPHMPDAKLKQIEPGGSGMVLMLGVDGTYEQLAHHTKFMPADYTSDLRAMFETRTVPDDPCIYVCATTRSDPSQAPDGCENLFVLCSAPPLDGKLDWSIVGPAYEARIVETLEHRFGLTDLSKRIVVRRRMTPADLAADYNAHRGSIYGISSNGLKAAFLRPPNRDKQIGGLYFAGGATHPGGGLPLVALSGKIASEMAADDLGLSTPSIETAGDALIATLTHEVNG
jgi:phytoene desaturase